VFYDFRVDSILPATPLPSYRISQIMLRARPGADEQQKLADKLRAIRSRARKAGLGAAAAERGLATQQTGYFDWNGGPPELFAMPQAAEWALTAPLRAVSGLFLNDDQMMLVQVVGKRPAGPRPLDEVRVQVRAMAETEARIETARATAMRVAAELARGATLDQAAGAVGLGVDRSQPFARRQPDPRLAGVPEVVGAAFGLDSAGVAGPLRARDGWYFLKVEQRVPPDVQAYQALEASIKTQLIQQKQQALFMSWVAAMRDRAKVQDLRPELGF
jgi:parvulin-like peptidyl-prolyl isomerase